jgi:hypothetical protein
MFHASKSTCDVRIGTNRFVGDLNRYHITATIEEISVDIELRGEVPAWGARQRRSLHGYRILHHSHRRLRLCNADRLHAGQGRQDHRRRRCQSIL